MHKKIANQISVCLERAEQCRGAADFESDERIREQLLSLAEQWQQVAESYKFLENREALLLHHSSPEVEESVKDFPPE